MNRALFLSLDGTIIKRGDKVFSEDWEFREGILQKIRSYYNKGYYICIVTNQGNISTGQIPKEKFENKLDEIRKEIEEYIKGDVNTAYVFEIASYYRKPNPGMAYHMALELNLSLRDSVMVGNNVNDNEFAKNAYIGTYFDIESFIL